MPYLINTAGLPEHFDMLRKWRDVVAFGTDKKKQVLQTPCMIRS